MSSETPQITPLRQLGDPAQAALCEDGVCQVPQAGQEEPE